jgi:hypothetical protein
MVCLRNICINTLHNGGSDDYNDDNNNNNLLSLFCGAESAAKNVEVNEFLVCYFTDL